MVIDTSAILAILLGEPEAQMFAQEIAKAPKRLIAAVNALECAIVIHAKKGPSGGRELDLLFHRAKIDIVGVDVAQVEAARRAWERFGKGRHPAGLNLGDCCAYALAKAMGENLLFKGGDFSQTDIAGQPASE